ncbi:MAG: hypothetical protein JST59_01565 [Actinobacteria bacterium]|nr:hypothetical protein [Actinomycetota bacterium]
MLRERKEEEEQRPPPFDVAVIKKEDAARKNQELQFFIEALEGWNTSFGRPEVKFDRARYEALKFIYFHLKNISLQNELIRNENIHRLYIWYQHYNNNFTPPLALRIRGSQFRQVKED